MVENLAAWVGYDYQVDAKGFPKDAKPPGAEWLRELFGDDFFRDAVRVSVRREVTDAGLEYLKGLSQDAWLVLDDSRITDAGLKHLEWLAQLSGLSLQHTKVTDAGLEYLKGLAQLEVLFLVGTKVTAEGVKKLQRALPNCKIGWTPPTPDERQRM